MAFIYRVGFYDEFYAFLQVGAKKSEVLLRPFKIISFTFAMASFAISAVFGEEIEYRQFKLEKVSCNVGIAYKAVDDRLDIGVAAIAYGMGAEFRKWSVTDIRIHIGEARIRANKSGKFFVTKESLFRFPAAIIFAVIGTQINASGSDLEKGITKVGAAIGLGLLVLQAKGDIAGENCVFNLDWDTLDKIYEGRDLIEITVENTDMHLKETIIIGLMRAPAKEARYDYSSMRQDELMQVIETLEGQVATLGKNLENYQYGIDPEYYEIQRKIEALEAERGMAYKTWFERQQ